LAWPSRNLDERLYDRKTFRSHRKGLTGFLGAPRRAHTDPGRHHHSSGLLVRLNFKAGRFLVFTPDKVALNRLDNSNGVDVELMLGNTMAVQNVVMTPVGRDFLFYRRSSCNGDPDPDRD
jgi:hypothetical protein